MTGLLILKGTCKLAAAGVMVVVNGRYLPAMKAMIATLMNLRRRGQFLGFSSSSLEKSMIWALIRCIFGSCLCCS